MKIFMGKDYRSEDEWLRAVYFHFQGCYLNPGITLDPNKPLMMGDFYVSSARSPKQLNLMGDPDPLTHIGYLYCKHFIPTHEPDLELIRTPIKGKGNNQDE